MKSTFFFNHIKSIFTKPFTTFIERFTGKKNLVLKTIIPVIYEETLPLKELRNKPITFWDYENSSDYDISDLNGHIFIIGNLNAMHVQNIMQLIENNKKTLKFHLFDSQHTQKNYADILIATFVGEILQACGSIKEINFISKDKGFNSIKHFLETQGINNVKILSNNGPNKTKVEIFKKQVENQFITSKFERLTSILKVGKTIGLSESEVYRILQHDYKFDYDYASDKVRIRYKL